MYEFYPTTCPDVVRAILSHPTQFPQLERFRGATIFEEIAKTCLCVCGLRGLLVLGLYVLDPFYPGAAKVHISILPVAWGATALEISAHFLEWTWRNTEYRKLIGEIDEGNRLAVRFARRMGMKQTGRIPMGLEKNGTKRDLVVMEISK